MTAEGDHHQFREENETQEQEQQTSSLPSSFSPLRTSSFGVSDETQQLRLNIWGSARESEGAGGDASGAGGAASGAGGDASGAGGAASGAGGDASGAGGGGSNALSSVTPRTSQQLTTAGGEQKLLYDFVMRLTDTPFDENQRKSHQGVYDDTTDDFSPSSLLMMMKDNYYYTTRNSQHGCFSLDGIAATDGVAELPYSQTDHNNNDNGNNNMSGLLCSHNPVFNSPAAALFQELPQRQRQPSSSCLSSGAPVTIDHRMTTVQRHEASPLTFEQSLCSRSTTTTSDEHIILEDHGPKISSPSTSESSSQMVSFFVGGSASSPSATLDAGVSCHPSLSFVSNNFNGASVTPSSVSTPSETPTWSHHVNAPAYRASTVTDTLFQESPIATASQPLRMLKQPQPLRSSLFEEDFQTPTTHGSIVHTTTTITPTAIEEQSCDCCDLHSHHPHDLYPYAQSNMPSTASTSFTTRIPMSNHYRVNRLFELLEEKQTLDLMDAVRSMPATTAPDDSSSHLVYGSRSHSLGIGVGMESKHQQHSVMTPSAFPLSASTTFSSPCLSAVAPGLRHLHAEAAAAESSRFVHPVSNYSEDTADDSGGKQMQQQMVMMSGTPISSSSANYRDGSDGGMYDWNNGGYPYSGTHDYSDRRNIPHNGGNSGGSISKGLTDFHSIVYASKRWQNLNVVLPLYIPHGTIAVLRSTGENTYVFSDQFPSCQLLFSGTGRVCDLWATYLRLRVAVIHKCPEFLVPRVAQVLNQVLRESLPTFSEPIHLRCSGVVKHTIQLRASGALTFRYDTIGQIATAADQEKMRILFDGLQKVMSEVNHYLAKEVEDVYRACHGCPAWTLDENHMMSTNSKNSHSDFTRQQQQCGLQTNTAHNNLINTNNAASLKCGLEFRFSPCKELKIAIREGTMCDCSGVDSMIAGGGASSMSTWAQQFIVEDLQVGELRMERDKTSETQMDPFFLPHAEVKTRMITKDMDGNAARICFVDPSFYPELCRPRVVHAIGLTPFQAAEQFVGATHQQLANLLPNGMRSLTTLSMASLSSTSPCGATGMYATPSLATLRGNREGVSMGHQLGTSGAVAPGSSAGRRVNYCLNGRQALTVGGRPLSFSQPISSTEYSGNGMIDPNSNNSALCSHELAGRQPHDAYSYVRHQQQQLGGDRLIPPTRHHADFNRETPTTTNDTTGDAALQGLAVLQKMLADLNLHTNTNNTKNIIQHGSGEEGAPSTALSSSSAFISSSQAEGARGLTPVPIDRRHHALLDHPEAASLLSQLHSTLQQLPYLTKPPSPVALATGDGSSTIATASHVQPLPPQDPVVDALPLVGVNQATAASPTKAAGDLPRPHEQQQHHIPSPLPFSASSKQQRLLLFDGELGDEITVSPHDEDDELGWKSKSVGATPLNYTVTIGEATSIMMESSPNNTVASISSSNVRQPVFDNLSPSSTTEMLASGKLRLNPHSGNTSTIPDSGSSSSIDSAFLVPSDGSSSLNLINSFEDLTDNIQQAGRAVREFDSLKDHP